MSDYTTHDENANETLKDILSEQRTTNELMAEIRDMFNLFMIVPSIAKCDWCSCQLEAQCIQDNNMKQFCCSQCQNQYRETHGLAPKL